MGKFFTKIKIFFNVYFFIGFFFLVVIFALLYMLLPNCRTYLFSPCATIIGVFLTFQFNVLQNSEQSRKNNMPFLVIDNYLPAYIIRSLQNKRTEVKDYCFLFKKFGNNKNNLVIPLRVNNIGIGLAIIENIQCSYKQLFASCKISDVSPIGSSKVIKKAGESIFLITVKNISQNQFKDLEFVIHFSDVQGNLYQTKFAIENIYNNEHINAELEHEILN